MKIVLDNFEIEKTMQTRLTLYFITAFVLIGYGSRSTDVHAAEPELRGVWLTNVASTVMYSRAQIAEAMDSLYAWGFNAVFPVVYNDGYTLYPSQEMQFVTGIPLHPGFTGRDVLADIITEAHRLGMEVHAWIEYGFCASFAANGGPVLQNNPLWAGKRYNQESAADDNDFYWLSQANSEVQQFLINLGVELAENYDLDGIQLDRVRYGTKKGTDGWPVASDFGYDEAHLQLYRDQNDGADMPATWTPTSTEFKKWRSEILDDFHQKYYAAVKEVNPNIMVSNTPVVYPYGYDNFMQNWPNWPKQGSVDFISPQLYRYNISSYRQELVKVLNNQLPAGYERFYPGMLIREGDYQADAALTKSFVDENRARNVAGGIFWFYEGVPALGSAFREEIFPTPVPLPFRDHVWRPKATIVEENDTQNFLSGNWTMHHGSGAASYYAFNDTLLTATGGSGAVIRYEAEVIAEAYYDVYVHRPYGTDLATNAPIKLLDGSNVIKTMNQTDNAGRGWEYVSTFNLQEGRQPIVEISTSNVPASQKVAADAIMLILNRQLSPDVVITSVPESGIQRSREKIGFGLQQNYPNPFNPVTTIRYTVGAHHNVPVWIDLSIFNLSGQKVATLVSAKQPAGHYEVQWDASGMASGVYLYKLSTGHGLSQTKKLVLIR